jgi:hypothetical protein
MQIIDIFVGGKKKPACLPHLILKLYAWDKILDQKKKPH